MNITPLPETITKQQIEALRNAFGHFYDEGQTSIFKDKVTGIHFEKPAELIDELWGFGIPKDTSLKHIGITLESWYETVSKAPEYTEATMTGAPDSPVSATTPNKEVISKEQIAKNDEAVAQRKADTEKSNQNVRDAIAQKQKLYAEEIQRAKELEAKLKGQKIYYKVTEEQSELKNQAKANPKQFIEDVAKNFEDSPIAKQVAYNTYQVLSEDSPQVQIEVLNKVVADSQIPDEFKDIAQILIDQKRAQFELAKQFVNIDGKVNIEFSNAPKEGFKEYDLGNAVSEHIQNLNSQNDFLNGIGDLSADQIKSKLLLKTGSWVSSQISKLPVDSVLAKTYNSEIVQLGLARIGLVEAVPWVAVEGSWIGKLAIGSGWGNIAGFIQGKAGIDLGVKKIAIELGREVVGTGTQVVTKTVGQVGKQSLNMALGNAVAKGASALALKLGFTTASAEIGATIGTGIIPVIGTIVGLILGATVGKLLEKIPWDKVKKWGAAIVGGITGLIALPFVGIGAAIGIGLGATGIAAALGGGLGGATLAGVGSGVAGFFGAMGSVFVISIGTPIIVTILAFPVVVIFILFIINSGAYVVPPSASSLASTNPYMSVEKIASPSGQLPSPTTITYRVTIAAKKDSLTAISIKAECHATKKNSDLNCPPEQIPPPPTEIKVGVPFIFTFTTNYGPTYQDSIVNNTITVNATSVNTPVSEIGSASVCFGNCPLECFAFPPAYWPSDPSVQTLKSLLTTAAGTISSSYPNLAQKVCANGTVNLCYNPSKFSQSFFGYHEHGSTCDIDFNTQVVNYGSAGALFLLTHEATHHIQTISSSYVTQFIDRVGNTEPSVCSYGGSDPYESMAEGDALYVGRPTIDANGSCITNYPSQYPLHYNFAKNVMFAP